MVSEAEFISLVKQGELAKVAAALQENPALASATADGASAVLWGVYYGHGDVARVAANEKGDIDVFEAAALGDQHVMSGLLKADPKQVQAFSGDGFTPLGLAAFFGHQEMVKILLQTGADPNVASKNPLGVLPLHSAMANGSKEIARILIDAGTDVNTANAEGWTPLHYAAHSGDMESARYLLSKGAKAGVAKSDGQTAASLAAAEGHSDLANLLAR